MAREAVVAGKFYPAKAEELIRQVESMMDKGREKERAIGIISPHAGYIYSGAVAGAVFSRIEAPDTVILLGPNHTGIGPVFSLYAEGSWRTPMGTVEIDTGLAQEIKASCGPMREDRSAHRYEHSLEVQLPFMQYLGQDFRIVPIVLGPADFGDCKNLAQAIASSIKGRGKDVLIVASSDMTHYEPHSSAEYKDKIAIDSIKKLDAALLLKNVRKHNISMCGALPVAVTLMAGKALGAERARLMKYQTSGEASGDFETVVGYAGIIIA